jgi:hypothetical protein
VAGEGEKPLDGRAMQTCTKALRETVQEQSHSESAIGFPVLIMSFNQSKQLNVITVKLNILHIRRSLSSKCWHGMNMTSKNATGDLVIPFGKGRKTSVRCANDCRFNTDSRKQGSLSNGLPFALLCLALRAHLTTVHLHRLTYTKGDFHSVQPWQMICTQL